MTQKRHRYFCREEKEMILSSLYILSVRGQGLSSV